MTTTKRQRKMSYRSSVTVNFVCATKFCFDPPFFNGSSPRALSAQYSAHHTSRKSQLARFHAHPFLRPDIMCDLQPLLFFLLEEAIAKHGKDNIKIYKTVSVTMYYAVTENKPKTFMKLVCLLPEEKVSFLDEVYTIVH